MQGSLLNISCSSAALAFFIILMAGCGATVTKPYVEPLSEKEILGIWEISEQSRDYLRNMNHDYPDESPSITINDDKSFILKNIPDCAFDKFGECTGKTVTIVGEWKIYRPNNNDGSKLHLFSKTLDPEGVVYSESIMLVNDMPAIFVSLGEQRPPLFFFRK